MLGSNILRFDSPEAFLGSGKSRYFSSNYKKIKTDIGNLEINESTISGDLNLTWPDLWAEKDGKLLKPHIGSLEFYVIAVKITEQYMSIVDNMKKECIDRVWIKDFYSKVGNEAIEESVAIPCKCSKISQTINNRQAEALFEIKVGKATVRISTQYTICEKTLCKSSCSNSSCVSINNILRSYNTVNLSYHELGYKIPMHKISNISVDKKSQCLTSSVELTNQELARDFNGIGSLFQPCFTYCDIILITGQLSQILLFNLDELTREKASNLWMRSVNCKYFEPITEIADVKLSVREFNKVVTKDIEYRTASLSLEFDGGKMISDCKFAYQLNSNKI